MSAALKAIRFPFLIVLFSTLAFFPAPREAVASMSASAEPGKTVFVRANSKGGFTRLCIGTTGSQATKVEIKSKNFNEIITIKPGDCMKLTKDFGKGKIFITNKSSSATIRVESKWL